MTVTQIDRLSALRCSPRDCLSGATISPGSPGLFLFRGCTTNRFWRKSLGRTRASARSPGRRSFGKSPGKSPGKSAGGRHAGSCCRPVLRCVRCGQRCRARLARRRARPQARLPRHSCAGSLAADARDRDACGHGAGMCSAGCAAPPALPCLALCARVASSSPRAESPPPQTRHALSRLRQQSLTRARVGSFSAPASWRR